MAETSLGSATELVLAILADEFVFGMDRGPRRVSAGRWKIVSAPRVIIPYHRIQLETAGFKIEESNECSPSMLYLVDLSV